jgi:hypothetical protein
MFRYIVLAAIVVLVIYTEGTIDLIWSVPYFPALLPKAVEKKKEQKN